MSKDQEKPVLKKNSKSAEILKAGYTKGKLNQSHKLLTVDLQNLDKISLIFFSTKILSNYYFKAGSRGMQNFQPGSGHPARLPLKIL